LRAIRRGELPGAPIALLLGLEMDEVEEGRVRFGVLPSADHMNVSETVHGGLAATMLDSAMWCAVYSTLPAGVTCTTLELKVNLVRPFRLDSGRATAEATVLHAGRRVATAEAKMWDGDGRLLAHATTTCLVAPEE
jgi:uncharacterized protein (TIGR00369 family)